MDKVAADCLCLLVASTLDFTPHFSTDKSEKTGSEIEIAVCYWQRMNLLIGQLVGAQGVTNTKHQRTEV